MISETKNQLRELDKRRYRQGLFLGFLGTLIALPLSFAFIPVGIVQQVLAFIAFDLLVYSFLQTKGRNVKLVKGLAVGQAVGWIIYWITYFIMLLLMLSLVFGAQ